MRNKNIIGDKKPESENYSNWYVFEINMENKNIIGDKKPEFGTLLLKKIMDAR